MVILRTFNLQSITDTPRFMFHSLPQPSWPLLSRFALWLQQGKQAVGDWFSHGVDWWTTPHTSEHNYWASSTASADTLWQTITNLADLAVWHPLIERTNAPRGQKAKPGLIYRAFSRYLPMSTQIFVERVLPGELLSVRVFPLPGLQERATYRVVSTLCGTVVLYSITLSGWLSPFVWPVVRPRVDQVATALVQAAELSTADPEAFHQKLTAALGQDIF